MQATLNRVGRGGLGEAAADAGIVAGGGEEEEGGHHLLLGAGRREDAAAATRERLILCACPVRALCA